MKNEEIDGDQAKVTTEIEVIDYSKTVNDTNNFKEMNREEFFDDNGIYDEVKFINYQLQELNSTREKVKYTLDFTLTKTDNGWNLDNPQNHIIQKINGTYQR